MFSCCGWFKLIFTILAAVLQIFNELCLYLNNFSVEIGIQMSDYLVYCWLKLFCVLAWFLLRGFSVGPVCIIYWTAYTVKLASWGNDMAFVRHSHFLNWFYIHIIKNYLFIWQLDEKLSSILKLQQCRFDKLSPARTG